MLKLPFVYLATIVGKICCLFPSSYSLQRLIGSRPLFWPHGRVDICTTTDLFRPLYSNCISLKKGGWEDQNLGTWHINYLGMVLVHLIQLGASCRNAQRYLEPRISDRDISAKLLKTDKQTSKASNFLIIFYFEFNIPSVLIAFPVQIL